MISEIMALLYAAGLLFAVLTFINYLKLRRFEDQKTDDVYALLLISVLFFVLATALIGMYSILQSPVGYVLSFVRPEWIPLAAYALGALPLAALSLLAFFFSIE